MSDKMTKSEMYAEISTILRDAGENELADFCDKEIESLKAKAEKAKERAAANRAKGDEFKAIVAGALTDEFQTGAQIYEAVGYVDAEDEDKSLTLGKVRARLTALVREGSAVKDEVSVEVDGKTKKVMGYRLA